MMTATGPTITNGSVLLRDGKIAQVGTNMTAPSDAVVIDGTGKYVTPGLIDVHSHMGDYPAPGVDATATGTKQPIQSPRTFGPSIRFGLRIRRSRAPWPAD